MKTYEYDYNKSLGDTIMEKYEALYIILWEHHQKYPIRSVIGHPDVISMFQTASCFESCDTPCQLGGLQFVGCVPGVKMRFECFISNNAAPNELILLGEKENALVEFVNFI